MSEEIESQLADIDFKLSQLVTRVEYLDSHLATISDGLFYLNLHLGAEVKPWTGDRR